MMGDVYHLDPVDRTAASVVSQKGCSDSLTSEQIRENLVQRTHALKRRMSLMRKNDPDRKKLGAEINETQLAINKIRPKKKAPGVQSYVMDILREDLSKFKWNSLMTRAVNRMNQDKP
jgi:hypothetical protein